MNELQTETLLIIICSVIVISYVFSILSRFIKIPSVLLLLFSGMLLRVIADAVNFQIQLPAKFIEMLGVVGLIMIVLEAGLDLKLGKAKIPLIRNSFLSALILLLLSSAVLTAILYYMLHEPLLKCMVYAIPLSIMSSSIVLPSLHALTPAKKEFLVYEASLSDILGILLFNFIAANEIINTNAVLGFSTNLLLSIVLSLVLSFVLFLIMAKTKLDIKFFLVFALLILIYSGGKIMHLPSLIIILVFGLMINNWEKIRIKYLTSIIAQDKVDEMRHLLHSITAETSFLIRTFFFILFGFTISLNLLIEREVVIVGGLMVLGLLLLRFLYLRFFLRTNLFPEVFFIPRGLITIVLFYKIPDSFKLSSFNEGILFFVIVATSLIMTIGMLFYKKPMDEMVEDAHFVKDELSKKILE